MKLHRIEIENLNSLHGGPHTIDFDKELQHAPLFLIMGATGAGKTTILDAICLTLFGTTPRIRDESGRSSVALPAQRMMSEGTINCRATLEFSLLDRQGHRDFYRAIWRSERTHKSPTGTVKNPHRSLEKMVDGQWPEHSIVSSNQKSDYGPHFTKILHGMSEESFLQSVMLAQGQFSAFLQASDTEKTQILERLTETRQYKKIGARARNVKKAKEIRVEKLTARLLDFPAIAAEEIEALKEELKTLSVDEEKEKELLEKAREQAKWLESFQDLRREKIEEDKTLKEAQKTKEDHKEDFTRLTLARRAQPVEKTLAEVDRLAKEEAHLNEKKPDLEDELEKVEKSLKLLVEEKKKALEKVKVAKKVLEEKQPALKEARNLRVKIKGASENLETATEAQSAVDKELKECRQQYQDAKKAHETAAKAQKEGAAALEKLAGYGVLVESLAGLETRHEAIATSLEEIKDRDARWKEAKTEAQTLKEARQKSEEIYEKITAEIDPLREVAAASEESLQALLGDAPELSTRRSDLRDELSKAQQIQSSTVEDLRVAEMLQTLSADLEEIKSAKEKLVGSEKDRAQKITTAADLLKAQKLVIDTTHEALRRIEQTVALSSKRETLKPDEPCPLCGSEDHPYLAQGTHDEADAKLMAQKTELEEDLGSKNKALDKAQEDLVELETSQKLAEKELETLENRRAKAQEKTKEHRETLEASLREAGVTMASDEDPLEVLEQALSQIKIQSQKLRENSEKLDAADESYKKAAADLREAEKGAETTKQEVETLAIKVENAEKRILELGGEQKAAVEKVEGQKKQFQKQMAKAGIQVEESYDFDSGQVLDRARRGRDEFVKAQKGEQEAAQAAEKAKTRQDTAEERGGDTRKRLEKAQEFVKEQKARVDGLQKKADALLDGVHPDEVEEKLKKSIEDATAAYDLVDSQRADASEKKVLADREVKATKDRLDEISKELKTWSTRLEKELMKQEFEDVEELRRALLPQGEFDALREKLEHIKKDLFAAEQRQKSVQERLEQQREKLPEELDPQTADLEELTARVEELDQRATTIGKAHTRKESKLLEFNLKKDRRKEILEERRGLNKDLLIWKEIHNMIGVRKGAAFQKYAQALNLRELIFRANEHLETLSKRYSLQVREEEGRPTLDFEVRDSHHANNSRALSTLSGGETFLVSLAMALALADYHRSELRMETLLLDEGFGTLDQDSLSTALSLLNSIHLEGSQQVGLISHVEALKERIPHRINVRQLGNGRSTIEVEAPCVQ